MRKFKIGDRVLADKEIYGDGVTGKIIEFVEPGSSDNFTVHVLFDSPVNGELTDEYFAEEELTKI